MKNKRLVLGWVALLGWMTFIFFMSNQPGEVSSKQSDLVVNLLNLVGIHLADKGYEMATFIVRKVAHFSEYAILCTLAINVLKNYLMGKKLLFISFCTAALYACSDEFHQWFIPGRGPSVRDVLIDSSGALFAIIIIIIIKKIKKK